MVVALVLAACGDENPSANDVCTEIAQSACYRLNACGFVAEGQFSDCISDLRESCCGGRQCPDREASYGWDELDRCTVALEEFGCDRYEAGDFPAACEALTQ